MMHDGFGTYPKYTRATHALCHAHHLRELKGFIEQGHTWASRMTTFLLAAKQAVEAHHGALSEEEAKRWERVYDRILERAQHRLETMTPLPKKALAFIRRLQKRKEEALRFLREVHVPFDNNQAERDLRMVKVKENISGTFREETFAQSFCITRSIVSTLAKHEKKRVGLFVSSVDRRHARLSSFYHLGHFLSRGCPICVALLYILLSG
ncbi:transposase [Anoxybacillus flavithermus NBRC 109594]|uniref:Transposase n=1 Tax=Anoxybacillus flavithermus NBRC 109594 TaxID=1315967 RepID=R4G0A0_9BACL|nr:transposase [Anoxybacillus flavithermus NBRC 109594]